MCECLSLTLYSRTHARRSGLSQNRILALTAPTPWPAPAVLQTLVLDENPISRIDATAFAALRSLQSLYVHCDSSCWSLVVQTLT